MEFDRQTERVTRVSNLPISDEARNTPREQYLLDSAHHGLAMNPAGTKLCVAGTMSDYAAIVSRQTFAPKVFSNGEKPYWSTNGLDGRTCWVSWSGDDKIVGVRLRARARAGAGAGGRPPAARAPRRRAATSTWPGCRIPPGSRDNLKPHLVVRGVPRRGCRRRAFRARVRVYDQSALRGASAALRTRRLRRTRRKSFSVRVPVRHLKRGRRHRLRVGATDAAGNRARKVLRFRRCR